MVKSPCRRSRHSNGGDHHGAILRVVAGIDVKYLHTNVRYRVIVKQLGRLAPDPPVANVAGLRNEVASNLPLKFDAPLILPRRPARVAIVIGRGGVRCWETGGEEGRIIAGP